MAREATVPDYHWGFCPDARQQDSLSDLLQIERLSLNTKYPSGGRRDAICNDIQHKGHKSPFPQIVVSTQLKEKQERHFTAWSKFMAGHEISTKDWSTIIFEIQT